MSSTGQLRFCRPFVLRHVTEAAYLLTSNAVHQPKKHSALCAFGEDFLLLRPGMANQSCGQGTMLLGIGQAVQFAPLNPPSLSPDQSPQGVFNHKPCLVTARLKKTQQLLKQLPLWLKKQMLM